MENCSLCGGLFEQVDRFGLCHGCNMAIEEPLKKEHRAARILSKYRLEYKDYEKMFKSSGCACGICRKELSPYKPPDGGGPPVACVDHCHKTGRVRGVLCSGCNFMLGFAKDDIRILSRAITYLEENSDE